MRAPESSIFESVLEAYLATLFQVRDLQFDATRVVSVGADSLVVVSDITTGEAVQRLRGHVGAVTGQRPTPDKGSDLRVST